jgi:hypothetical protein
MVLIHFKNEFKPDDPKTDPNILEKIITEEELSGLLNLALDGLKRILKQGHFTGEEGLETRRDDWVKNSNPAQYFVYHFISVNKDPFHYIPKTQLYKQYVQMCHSYGKRPTNDSNFSKIMNQLLPYTQDGFKDVPGGKDSKGKNKTKKIRVWYGINVDTEKLKKFIEEHQTDTHDTQTTAIPTLNILQKDREQHKLKVRNSVASVSSVSENVERLLRIAKTYVKDKGTVEKRLLYNMLFEAGFQDRDIVDSVLGDDPDIVFTEEAVRWREGEAS